MFTMTIEGGDQLARNLATLSTRVSKSIVKQALVEGAEPIRKAGSQNAPYRPGPPDLRDNIGISTARTEDMAAVKIGPTKGFAYGIPQEFGTIHHPAHPFMRPAFDTKAPEALGIIGAALWRALAGRGFIRTETTTVPVQSSGGGGLV